jgi:hypothetical protein
MVKVLGKVRSLDIWVSQDGIDSVLSYLHEPINSLAARLSFSGQLHVRHFLF